MKRFLHNWFEIAAFTFVMLLSAACWPQASKLQGPLSGPVTGSTLGVCPTWYADNDGDGFGSMDSIVACEKPPGYVANSTDCDDNDATVWKTTNLFVDIDGDGYYGGTEMNVCWGATPPAGYATSTLGLDCNDHDPLVYNNADVYIDVDGDHYTHGPMADVCYGDVLPPGLSPFSLGKDCDDNDPTVWTTDNLYIDWDGDGYDGGMAEDICYGAVAPMGYMLSSLGADCNDADAAINPAATEIQGNHIDENCNGEEDDAVGEFMTQLKDSQCDGTLDHIYNACVAVVNTPNVTQYYYEITNTLTLEKQNINTPDYFFQLTDLASYDYETTYAIRCGMDVDNIWQGYGSTCYVTTPSLTSGPSAIVIPQCGTTLAMRNSPIFVTGPGFVSSYEVLAYNMTTMEGQTIVRTLPWFTIKMLTDIYDYDTEYQVQVRVQTTGSYSAYSAPCTITTPPAPMAKTATSAPAFEAVAYPNPFTDGFTVNLSNPASDDVHVKVYDMMGKLLEVRDVQATDIEAQKLGNAYPPGVYNVVITQGETVESIRVIKR